MAKAREWPGLEGQYYVRSVTCAEPYRWDPDGRLVWSLTVFAGVALIARGIFLKGVGLAELRVHAAWLGGLAVSGVGASLLIFRKEIH